jgi:hypothetical protein
VKLFTEDPKHIRLSRLRSPITLGETLAHPAIGVDVKKLAAEAGVATALSTLLTPIAAASPLSILVLHISKDRTTALSQTTEPVPTHN